MSRVDRRVARLGFLLSRRDRVRMQSETDFQSRMTQSALQSVDASTLDLSASPRHQCGVLSDGSIVDAVRSGQLVIDPFNLKHVGPCTYDLTVALTEPVTLEHMVFHLLSTSEKVVIPSNMRAAVHGRSSLGRKALLVHFTAGFIDPGFEGQITLEVMALADSVLLKPGDRVAQIEFSWLDRPVLHPYNGRYQGQMGIVPSRFRHGDD